MRLSRFSLDVVVTGFVEGCDLLFELGVLFLALLVLGQKVVVLLADPIRIAAGSPGFLSAFFDKRVPMLLLLVFGDPQAWLADILARIASTPQGRLNDLLPWEWKKATANRDVNEAAKNIVMMNLANGRHAWRMRLPPASRLRPT